MFSNMQVPSKRTRLVLRVFKGYSKSLKFSNTIVVRLEKNEDIWRKEERKDRIKLSLT